jgi:isoamylase
VRSEDGERVPDVVWLRPDGRRMQPEDWDNGFGLSVGIFLNGQGIREKDRRGMPVSDQNFLVYFNSGDDAVDAVLPDERHGHAWNIVVDTGGERASDPALAPGAAITLEASSMLVLREVDATEVPTDDSVEASLRVQTERADAPSPAPAAELPR